ncbi:hypothetical protein [Actinocatenispora comari]|uniref:Uncharacterized protein n=1 Tax=Actinocatenispora comari TaxID=2807577 RepID=A0A8J4AEU4_9ACTN|nr:hypothetical protein [Actinocatenispora comari]GIL29340.1 hypothetical protein NUM_45940 [Actinocatenispora comari]
MSEQQLRDLLRDKAEPVQPPALAESSWRLAAVRRRRRRATAGTAAAVVAVALLGAGALGGGLPGTTRHPSPPAHRSTGDSAADALPLAATRLPRTIDTDPAHAEPLSTHPVEHALGLFAAYPAGWPQVLPRTSVVLVLGDDGRMRRIDTVRVLGSRDGYEPAPIAPGALNAAGTRAAFPQPDGTLLTVDLTGTGHRSYRMATGTVESLWWNGDAEIVVSTSELTRVLDLATGRSRLLPFGDALMPRYPNPGTGFLAMPVDRPAGALGPYNVAVEVRSYDERGHRKGYAGSWNGLHGWYGPGVTNGSWAVRASSGTRVDPDAQNDSVVAVPVNGNASPDAVVVTCPGGNGPHQKASCRPLGWAGPDRLLVVDHAHSQHQLLSVDLRTEKVSAVARLTGDAQVAIRPGGY